MDVSYPVWLSSLEAIVVLWYPVGLLFADSRSSLFDLELIAKRALVYGTLTALLSLVFYATLGAAGAILSNVVEGEYTVWAVASATLVVGLVLAPLRRFVEPLIYRRFFPQRVAMRRHLADLADELPGLGKLPAMGARLVDRLEPIFGTQWATLLIADPKSEVLVTVSSNLGGRGRQLEHSLLIPSADRGLQYLARTRRPISSHKLAARSATLAQRLAALHADLVAPLVDDRRLVGLLVLGPRRNGARYHAEEVELINLLCQHVVTVLENARLFESATLDSLTGLMRREAILDALDKELVRARRYRRPLSVAMIDIDNFKFVNDRFGHLAGDSLLKWVAHSIARNLRSTDRVGRFGGEEFLAVYPETDVTGAVRVSDKMRSLVAQHGLETEGGGVVRVTVSVGVATLPHDEPLERDELLRAADRALYHAKDSGRNQVNANGG